MIRVAAVGDLHVGQDCVDCVDLAGAGEDADVLLLAGDLTRVGDPAEAALLAEELSAVRIPVVAVLGNHDHHSDKVAELRGTLAGAGATVLEGDSTVLDLQGATVGIAGTKGFGGGFPGACGSEFGEPEMKDFMAHSRMLAERLQAELSSLDTDIRVALLHYAPIEGTLEGERREIYPFLGSYLLGEAIDCAGADLALHGHAHRGTEKGATPAGVPVRNVARPVIQRRYNVYMLDKRDRDRAARPVPEALETVAL
ncbi:MAG: metallophosphoesterase family protein [Acidimicrobiales bacterium]